MAVKMANNLLELENLIWLGCGDCSINKELKLYCENLLLVDAFDAAVYNQLSDNVVANQVYRKNSFVAEAQTKKFHLISPSKFSTSVELERVFQVLPGCKHLETLEMKPKGIPEIVNESGLEFKTYSNCLIIDFDGLSTSLLTDFFESPISNKFLYIIVRLSRAEGTNGKPYHYVNLMRSFGFIFAELLEEDFGSLYFFSKEQYQLVVEAFESNEKFEKINKLEKVLYTLLGRVEEISKESSGYFETLIENSKSNAERANRVEDSLNKLSSQVEKMTDSTSSSLNSLTEKVTEHRKRTVEIERDLSDLAVQTDLIKNSNSSSLSELAETVKQSDAHIAKVEQSLSALALQADEMRESTSNSFNSFEKSSILKFEQIDKAWRGVSELLTSVERELSTNSNSLSSLVEDSKINYESLPSVIKEELLSNNKALNQSIDIIIKGRAANVVTQLEAYDTIKRFLQYGVIPVHFHGWPVSPDIAVRLIDMITTQKFDLIIEFGSGTSTLIMCSALAKTSSNQSRFVSFEHLDKYYNSTLSMLKRHGVEEFVDLCHAPLSNYEAAGTKYMHYACEKKLKEVYDEIKPANVLVLVDGPPGSTNRHARYPAFPKIMNIFKQSNLTVFMDDYARIDEKECVEMWEKDAVFYERPFNVTSLSAEKGLAIIKVGKREV